MATQTMVLFRTARGRFALPVTATSSVRTTEGLVELPTPAVGTLGVLPGRPPLTVLTTLGAGRDHVLVVTVDDVCFGLHVHEVLGVRRYDDDEIGPAPAGQQDALILGTATDGDELVLVADARELAARL